MKQCPACAKLGLGPKPESEFHRSHRDGIQSRCKVCSAATKISPEARERYNADKRAQYTGAARLAQIEKSLIWSAKNPEKVKASLNVRSQCEEFKEKARKRTRAWAALNPTKVNEQSARWRAYKMQRTPKWVDLKKVEDFYAQAQAAREFFGEVEWHVDHIVPLRGKRVSGLHVENNLQVIPGIENLRKSNRSQIEFGKDMRDLVRAALAS